MLGSPVLYLKAMSILMFPTFWLLPKPESHPNPDPILGPRNPPNEVAQNGLGFRVTCPLSEKLPWGGGVRRACGFGGSSRNSLIPNR